MSLGKFNCPAGRDPTACTFDWYYCSPAVALLSKTIYKKSFETEFITKIETQQQKYYIANFNEKTYENEFTLFDKHDLSYFIFAFGPFYNVNHIDNHLSN